MTEPNYACIAYETWAQEMGWTYNDMDLSYWRDLSRDEQAAWEAAVDKVLNALIPGDAP